MMVSSAIRMDRVRIGAKACEYAKIRGKRAKKTNLESFVLQDLFDGYILLFFWNIQELGSKNNTKGAVSDDLAVGIGDFSLLAALAVRGDDLDDFARIIDGWAQREDVSDGNSGR